VSRVYRLTEGLLSRSLGDETVVYLPDRFETHLLDEAGAQVLECALAFQSSGRAAFTAADALTWLMADQTNPNSSDMAQGAQALDVVLADLCRVGVLA